MRIIYVATSFPEPSRGDTIYTDLAEALRESGHFVTVIVAEQRRNLRKTKLVDERNLKVLRVSVGDFYDVGLVKKGISTLLMPFQLRHAISCFLPDERFDLVLSESPPITNQSLVRWLKKRYDARSFLMLKDIFPQNAVDIGIIKRNSIIYRFFKGQEQGLYKSVDVIGCMSKANMEYLAKHNPNTDKNKIIYFPNTKRVVPTNHLDTDEIRRKYQLPVDKRIFLLGGNMGKPQYVELMCNALKELKDEESVYFLFIGRGTERYKITSTITEHNIRNARIMDHLPRKDFDEIVKSIDVGLITLDPRFTIPNYPSRILSYMEASIPVLAATDNMTDLKALIDDSNCGYWVWSGDVNGFISKIKEVTKDKDLIVKGQMGFKYLKEHFDVALSVKILEKYAQGGEIHV